MLQPHSSGPGLEGPSLTVAKGRLPMPPSLPPLPGQSLMVAKPLVVKTITLLPAKADCQRFRKELPRFPELTLLVKENWS